MSTATDSADTLIHPGWIVPVVPRGTVLEDYSIALTGDRISALLPREAANSIRARRVIDTIAEMDGVLEEPVMIRIEGT